MKAPEQVLQDIQRRLTRTWPGTVTGDQGSRDWPHDFPLGDPSATELTRDWPDLQRYALAWRAWAAERNLTLLDQTRLVHGTRQRIPTHLRLPDADTAAAVRGGPWPHRLAQGRQRASALRARRPQPPDLARTIAAVDPLSDLDFELLQRAADWFSTRSAAGLTPREVPIEGLHAKWLNTRQALVRELAGVDDLQLLPPHPARLHFTYLDQQHLAAGGRRHDCATVGDHAAPAYLPRVVVICENKDTALHLRPVDGGISVEGVGRGGSTAAAFDWITSAPNIFYWGDMDADGLEILHGFRAAGVPATSLLMSPQAYQSWERYGTNHDAHGQLLSAREPRPVPRLTAEEATLYRQLISPRWTRHRRVEQERIPLDVADREIHRHVRAQH